MTDLDKLIEAVESGEMESPPIGKVFGFSWKTKWASAAFGGSLDAAKALHEALLPGWHWTADDGQGQDAPFWVVFKYTNTQWTETDRHEGQAESSLASRAWLIAILKAHRAQQETEK